MTGYYRQSVADYANIAEPLVSLTRKREPFIWGPEQEQAFSTLKKALVSSPVLTYPDTTKPYVLHTDASDKAVGAILTQEQDGQDKVIAYLSHQLSAVQRRWAAIEREAYAVVYALDHLKEYLWGAQFVIYTDHKPLTSLFRSEIRNTKIQRWAVQISEFGAPIMYRPGKHNVRADMLSRIASINAAAQTPNAQAHQTGSNYPKEDYPLPWESHNLDPRTMSTEQKADFPSCWEAGVNTQEGYVIAHGFLYSSRKPTDADDDHLRLVLPSRYHHTAIELVSICVDIKGLQKPCLWSVRISFGRVCVDPWSVTYALVLCVLCITKVELRKCRVGYRYHRVRFIHGV